LVSRADVRRRGASALALSWVAAGRADIACNLAVSAWDVAAGAGLVRAAGGVYLPIGPARAGVATAGADPVVTVPGFVAAADAGSADARSDLFRWIAAELRDVADVRDRTAAPVEFAKAQACPPEAWGPEESR
jgi:myo-inositol-1(or 4)-monophosphatase